MRTRSLLAACLLLAAPLGAQRLKLSAKLPELEERARADSNDAAAHYNVALGYWSAKRYDDAERELRTAVTIEPRFAPAHLAIAYLPFARRPKLWDELANNEVPADQLEALKASDREYRHAFLIDPMVDLRILGAAEWKKPDFIDAQRYLGEVWALFFQGFADCQEGKYKDCHGRFVTLIREIDGDRYGDRIPNSVLWYKGIAAAHIADWDDASNAFRLLLTREDRDSAELAKRGEFSRVPLHSNEYRYVLATILTEQGKTGEAISMFRQVLENDIGYYMANVRLANIYEGMKDYPHAVQERMAAANTNPDDASLLLDLGVTLGKAGMMPQAETRLQAAVDANPRDTRAWFWLGLAQLDQGKKDAARQSLTTFVALAPSRYAPQVTMAKQRLAQLQ